MKKKRENPRPEQPSSVAVVALGNRCWVFYPQHFSWKGSIGYKTREKAVAAALAAGFKTVKCDGKVIAKIKTEPKEATEKEAIDGQQEESIEEGAQEADPGASERTGV